MSKYASLRANFPGFGEARIPQDIYAFFDDFLGTSFSDTGVADQSVWLKSEVATQAVGGVTILDGTDDAEDEAGGILKIATGATVDEGDNLQVNGEAFHLADGYPLYFETRINVADVSNLDFFIGLAPADTEIITGSKTTEINRIGFELEAGVLNFLSSTTTLEKRINSNITETDDDWIRLAFFWDGDDNVHAWVDTNDNGSFDKYIGRVQASVATDYVQQAIMFTPTIEAITGTTATAEMMYIDYILCSQQRYRE